MLKETKAFFGFDMFESFSCPPLASGSEKVFSPLQRATGKIELSSFNMFNLFLQVEYRAA